MEIFIIPADKNYEDIEFLVKAKTKKEAIKKVKEIIKDLERFFYFFNPDFRRIKKWKTDMYLLKKFYLY